MAKAFIKHIDVPQIGLNGTKAIIEASSADPVHDIIRDLPKVKMTDKVDRSSISIPSPWAVFLSFDSIFFGDTAGRDTEGFGVLAEEARKDWRAMLTLLAFRPLLGIDVRTSTFYIRDNVNEEKFFDLISKTAPKNRIFGGRCWDEITLIKVGDDEKVIGAFSNSSLICPGYKIIREEFKKEFSRCPGLFENDEDDEDVYPLAYIRKTRFRCLYMYKWLSAVLEILTKINIYKDRKTDCDSKGYADIIIDELRDFRKSIAEDKLNKETMMAMKGLVRVKINDAAIAINTEGSRFRALSSDEQRQKKERIRTSVRRLVDRGSIRNLFEMLSVIIDFNVPYIKDAIRQGNKYFIEGIEDIGEKADGIELKSIYDMNEGVENTSYEIRRLAKDEVIQNDDIFTDKLGIIFDPGHADGVPMLEKHFVNIGKRKIEGAGDVEYCCYALIPIKKAVINEGILGIRHAEIKRSIQYDIVGDSIHVTLKGRGKPIVYRYLKDKIINISFHKLPNICIWPYIRIVKNGGENAWNDYYAYIERTSSARSARRGNDEKIIYSFKENTVEASNKLDMASGRLGERVIVKLSELPEYIFVDNKSSTSSEEAGIIVLNEPEQDDIVMPSQGEEAILGIDFGTTSSTMFCKIGSDPIKFVEFGNKYKMKLENNSQYVRQNVRSEQDICMEDIVMTGNPETYFLPKNFFDRKAYLSSYLITSSNNDVNKEMLLKGHIVFDESQTGNNDNTKLIKNAKWGRDVQSSTIRFGYLLQFLKLAEFTLLKTGRVNKITLRASYPTAMSDYDKSQFATNYRSIITALNKSAPGVFTFGGLFTESITSAAVYRNSAVRNYVCIDIGGGSSDVSLWNYSTVKKRSINIFQSSFKYASRDIFVPALARFVLLSSPKPDNESQLQSNIKRLNPRYIEAIDNAKREYALNPRETIKKLGIELEEGLFKFSDEIMALHNDADEDIVKVFDRDIIAGFFAIVYYTVLAYAKGVKIGRFKPINDDLTICFAGNGSKMYSWISEEYLERMQGILTALANNVNMGIIFAGKGHKVKFIEPSIDDLKTEAARGLVMIGKDAKTDNRDILINGDFICFATESGKHIVYTSGDDIKAKRKVKNLFSVRDGSDNDRDEIESPNFRFEAFEKKEDTNRYFIELERYVNALNRVLHYDEMKIDFNDALKNAFRKRFVDVYNEFIDQRSMVPVFIAEVMAFIDVIKEDNTESSIYDEYEDYSDEPEDDYDDDVEINVEYEDDEVAEVQEEDLFANKYKEPERTSKPERSILPDEDSFDPDAEETSEDDFSDDEEYSEDVFSTEDEDVFDEYSDEFENDGYEEDDIYEEDNLEEDEDYAEEDTYDEEFYEDDEYYDEDSYEDEDSAADDEDDSYDDLFD